jgi:hypothetical protein
LNIDGSSATSATGVELGETGTTAHIVMNLCQIHSFNIGVEIGDTVNSLLENCVITKNGTGIVIDATSTSLPTTTTIRKCRIGESTGIGIDIKSTWLTNIEDTIIESNGLEAIKAVTTATKNAYMINVVRCWIEEAYSGHGSQTANYAIVADGSAGSTCSMTLRDVYFNSNSKSINFNTVVDFVLDNVRPKSASGSVYIHTAGSGNIISWPHNNYNLQTCVTIEDNLQVRLAQPHAFISMTDGDATPDVSVSMNLLTANTNPTTITDFDGGYDGQKIYVVFSDAQTTIDFTGTNLHGNGGVDWSPGSDDHMVCAKMGSSDWYCDVSEN